MCKQHMSLRTPIDNMKVWHHMDRCATVACMLKVCVASDSENTPLLNACVCVGAVQEPPGIKETQGRKETKEIQAHHRPATQPIFMF